MNRLGLLLAVFGLATTGLEARAQKALVQSSFASAGESAGARFGVAGTLGQAAASQTRQSGNRFGVDGGFQRIVIAIQTPGAPTLSVNTTGGDVIVSWPSEITGWILQQSDRVGPGANWQDSSGVSNNSTTVALPGGTRFYRLRRE